MASLVEVGMPAGAELKNGAWRSWLLALASDADAALAAALAYEALDDVGRRAWLDALDEDAPSLEVPPIALYAPLLAVETDDERRTRIELAVGETSLDRSAHALVGGEENERVCVISVPLYLSFVEVLVCRYSQEGGVVAAHHEPLRHRDDVHLLVEDEKLAPASIRSVIDELAHAVLADKREGRPSPLPLAAFAHLFGLDAGCDTAA
jgi:hypothetical protein